MENPGAKLDSWARAISEARDVLAQADVNRLAIDALRRELDAFIPSRGGTTVANLARDVAAMRQLTDQAGQVSNQLVLNVVNEERVCAMLERLAAG